MSSKSVKRWIYSLIASVLLAAPVQGALTDNLVSYWKFDEASGTSLADAHGSNTGTLTGTEAWVTGKLGNAFDFTPNARFSVGTDDSLNITTAGTIAAWIHADNLGEAANGRILDRLGASGGYEFQITSSAGNKIAFFARPDATVRASTGTISFDVWQHVAVTWNGTALTFYINGAAAGTATLSAGVTGESGVGAGIGGRLSPTDRDFDGEIDELAIWSRELSLSEIEQLYNGGDGLAYPLSIGKPSIILQLQSFRKPCERFFITQPHFALAP